MHRAHRASHRACMFTSPSLELLCIFRVAGTWWPKGVPYNNGGLHSTSSPMVLAAAHTPSHRNLAWRPSPQPRHTGGGGMVVRFRKKHKGKENKKMLPAHVENARTARVSLS